MNRQLIIWGSFAILGVIAYFGLYPQIDTLRFVDAGLEEQLVEKNATHIAHNLEYLKKTASPPVLIKENRSLRKIKNSVSSRNELITHLEKHPVDQSALYPWVVGFEYNRGRSSSGQNEFESKNIDLDNLTGNKELEVWLTHQGKWLGLINKKSILPATLFFKSVLLEIKPEWEQAMKSLPEIDSLAARRFQFNFSEKKSLFGLSDQGANSRTAYAGNSNLFQLDRSDAFKMAQYYLRFTRWKEYEFSLDSVTTVTYQNYTAGRLFLKRNQDFAGTPLYLKIDLLPSGNILHLEPVIMESIKSAGKGFKDTFELIQFILIIILGLITVYQLFNRLRDRSVDLKTGLVVSIVASVFLPASILMVSAKSFISAGTDTTEFVIIFLSILAGFGAAGVILFFSLVSVGESVSRQVWPEKIKSFDLIRSGYFLNKPVGSSLIYATFAAFIALGSWVVYLYLIPNLFANISPQNVVFISNLAVAPFIYPVIDAAWKVSLTVLILYLIVGGLVYRTKKRLWAVYATSFLLFSIFSFITGSYTPAYYSVLGMGFLGLFFTYVFLNCGAVTVFLGMFQFTLFEMSVSSWLPAGSPDISIFITILSITAGLLTVGIIGFIRGANEEQLPAYVPEYVETLAQENRIHQELEIAKRVQASFLPQTMPRIAPLDLAAICDPAYETAGDYFDVIQLDEHRMAIAIGDVSGKGIQAAFYMTLVKGIIHSLCHEIEEPLKLLSRANDIFYRNSSKNTFISMIYGVFDTRDNCFTFVRAGHSPVIFKRDGEVDMEQLQPKGLGLGIVESNRFKVHLEEKKIYLQNGDTLVLFTDGLNEATNRHGQFYGMKRLRKIIQQSKADSAHQLLLEIKEDILKFVGDSEQHDDLTLVVLKLNEQMMLLDNEITPVMLGGKNQKLL